MATPVLGPQPRAGPLGIASRAPTWTPLGLGGRQSLWPRELSWRGPG